MTSGLNRRDTDMRGVIASLALFAAFGQWQSDSWVLPLINGAPPSTKGDESGAWTPETELRFRAVFGTFTFLTPQAITLANLLAAARFVAPRRARVMAPFLNAVCLVTAVMFILLRLLGAMHFDKANHWRAQWDFVEESHPWYGYWCWAFHLPLLICPLLDARYHPAQVTGATYFLLLLYLIVFHVMIATTLLTTGALPYPWYVDMYRQGAPWGTVTFTFYIAFLALLLNWVLRALSRGGKGEHRA